jgi:hypothetical protein
MGSEQNYAARKGQHRTAGNTVTVAAGVKIVMGFVGLIITPGFNKYC